MGSQYELSELRNQNEHLESEYKRLQKELQKAKDAAGKQTNLAAGGFGVIGGDSEALKKKTAEYNELNKKYSELEAKSKGFEQELTKIQYDKMLREKLGMQDQEKVSKEVEEARKAVYEKNKMINELSNKIRELEQQQ